MNRQDLSKAAHPGSPLGHDMSLKRRTSYLTPRGNRNVPGGIDRKTWLLFARSWAEGIAAQRRAVNLWQLFFFCSGNSRLSD